MKRRRCNPLTKCQAARELLVLERAGPYTCRKGSRGRKRSPSALKIDPGASCETLAASSSKGVRFASTGSVQNRAPDAHSSAKALHSPPEPGAAMSAPALRHVTKISSLSPKEIKGVLKLALEMKARPADYWDALKRRTLLMFFEKPSLRTRVSLEAGTTRCGNQDSPRHRRDVISTQA